MEKKRSVAVALVGVIIFVLSIVFFWCWSVGFPFPIYPFVHPLSWIGIGILLQPLFWLIYLISSFNILRLRNWARVLLIRFSVFVISVSLICLLDVIRTPSNYFKIENLSWGYPSISTIMPKSPILEAIFIPIFLFWSTLLSGLLWYFFTRPKVKEQFK